MMRVQYSLFLSFSWSITWETCFVHHTGGSNRIFMDFLFHVLRFQSLYSHNHSASVSRFYSTTQRCAKTPKKCLQILSGPGYHQQNVLTWPSQWSDSTRSCDVMFMPIKHIESITASTWWLKLYIRFSLKSYFIYFYLFTMSNDVY